VSDRTIRLASLGVQVLIAVLLVAIYIKPAEAPAVNAETNSGPTSAQVETLNDNLVSIGDALGLQPIAGASGTTLAPPISAGNPADIADLLYRICVAVQNPQSPTPPATGFGPQCR